MWIRRVVKNSERMEGRSSVPRLPHRLHGIRLFASRFGTVARTSKLAANGTPEFKRPHAQGTRPADGQIGLSDFRVTCDCVVLAGSVVYIVVIKTRKRGKGRNQPGVSDYEISPPPLYLSDGGDWICNMNDLSGPLGTHDQPPPK